MLWYKANGLRLPLPRLQEAGGIAEFLRPSLQLCQHLAGNTLPAAGQGHKHPLDFRYPLLVGLKGPATHRWPF
jgi:hypothetical protein